MLKRLSIALLSVLSLLFVTACGLTMHGIHCLNDWEPFEPWFGEEPDILSASSSEYVTTWIVKEDRERLKQLAEALHAVPLTPDDDEPCSPDADEVVFETATPVRLRYADGELFTEPHHLRIICEADGTARVEWIELSSGLNSKGVVDVTADCPKSRPGFLTQVWREWGEVAIPIALFGPTLPVNAWLLLLLSHALDKRLLWYVLPLVYEGIQILYVVLLDDVSITAYALPTLILWPFFSLLQSLIFKAFVRLVQAATRCFHPAADGARFPAPNTPDFRS